jgi:uncharacterized membrane protein
MRRHSLSRNLFHFLSNRTGSIAVVSAALAPIVIGCLALAVDMGSLYLERRQAQGAADLAAIAGAADLERADAAVRATLDANGVRDTSALQVTKGLYTADPLVPVPQRFRAGGDPINALEVVLRKNGRLYFASAFVGQPLEMEVRALAANASLATFSIGSRLAAVRDGILNKLLGAMLGTSINLTVMDYEGLVNADVQLLGFLQALAGELHLSGVSYTDILNASATVGNVFRAAATATAASGNSAAAVTLRTLASQAGNVPLNVPLSHLVDLGPFGSASIGQAAPGLDSSLNAMDLVNGTASLANGQHQLSLDLGATVPGLLSLRVDVTVGERPQYAHWVAVGQPGATVYTAQTRLRAVAEVGGTGVLAGLRIRLPLAIDIAYGSAKLSRVTCSLSDPSTAEARIMAKPGIAKAWIGELSGTSLANISQQPSVSAAKIVDTPLIKVTGRANIEATNTADTQLDFTQADVEGRVIKRVGTTEFVETLVSSLLRNLTLQVQLGGLGIGLPGTVSQAVVSALTPVAAPLDQVLYALLSSLGVHLGEADVRVYGIRCGNAVLAG